jgi:hypothetical protein
MFRICPACSSKSVATSELFFSNSECSRCATLVGVHWAATACFSVVIFVATLISTVMVLSQMGLYAALIWFPFPIGSLTYIKVHMCPLAAKQLQVGPKGGPAT